MDYYKLKVLNHKKKIVIIIIVLSLICILVYYYFNYYKDNENIILNDNIKYENSNVSDSQILYVDIKGYVSLPGVYSFKTSDNARINDLILKAGGLKKEADTSILNLSKKLEDEMTVIIYSKSEVENYIKTQESLKNKLELCEIKLKNNACIKEDSEINNSLVNINTATKEELMTLNGIGESKALAIIEYRKKNKFQEINDILNVEGIGENLFENIKNNIKV